MDIKKVFAYTVGCAKIGIGLFAGFFPAISLMLFEFAPKGPEQLSLLHLSRFFGVREFAMGCGLFASHGTKAENLVLAQLLLSDTVDFLTAVTAYYAGVTNTGLTMVGAASGASWMIGMYLLFTRSASENNNKQTASKNNK